MIGAPGAHHVAVGDGGEVAEEVLAALVGGDEAEPAGVPAARHAGLALAPRGRRRPVSAPRAESGIGCGTCRGAIGSGCGRGGRRGNASGCGARGRRRARRRRRRGARRCRGGCPGGSPWWCSRGCQGSAWGIEHTWRPRSGGGADGLLSFLFFVSTDRPVFFPSHRLSKRPDDTAINCPTSDRHKQRRNSNCLRLLGAHRWASRAARFGGRTPRCGSAASPRAR